MTITQVHYQKLVNLGDYENERFGAWATVGEGETPEDAIAALQAWVEARAGETVAAKDRLADLQGELRRMENERARLEGDVRTARERWTRARGWLEGIGLQMPSRFGGDDDPPF